MAKVVANWLSHNFSMIGCELFTHPIVIPVESRPEGVLLLVAKVPQVCHPMALMPQWQKQSF
jgi:hypothetical protein